MKPPVVDLRTVEVHYSSGPPWARKHVRAMRDVSFTIEEGETLGLVGESGSGKSTTGKVCLGLVRPTGGEVQFDGTALQQGRQGRKGAMGAVLQHPQWSLNPRLQVGTSVAEPLIVNGIGTKAEHRGEVAAILENVGLEASLATRYPHELSGGQRQRVAIARALITHPKFIVFDEAVSALDVSVQAQILNLIKELQAQAGFAALFISHDLAAVRYIAHRVAVMYAGEVVEFATSETFYGRGLHPYTRGLQVASDLIDEPDASLPGATEDVAPDGCALAFRCPVAVEQCKGERPLLRPIGEDLVACHRAAPE